MGSLMPINADKVLQWKEEIFASVDMFNAWFMTAAPQAFKDTRERVTTEVAEHLVLSKDCRAISGSLLMEHPSHLGHPAQGDVSSPCERAAKRACRCVEGHRPNY